VVHNETLFGAIRLDPSAAGGRGVTGGRGRRRSGRIALALSFFALSFLALALPPLELTLRRSGCGQKVS